MNYNRKDSPERSENHKLKLSHHKAMEYSKWQALIYLGGKAILQMLRNRKSKHFRMNFKFFEALGNPDFTVCIEMGRK